MYTVIIQIETTVYCQLSVHGLSGLQIKHAYSRITKNFIEKHFHMNYEHKINIDAN